MRACLVEARPKRPRIRLDPEAHMALCKHVLARDNWRCQSCGASETLQVHHVRSRSKLGHDCSEKLITLSAGCHESLHSNRQESSKRVLSPSRSGGVRTLGTYAQRPS